MQRCQTNAAYHPPAVSAKRASERPTSQPTRRRSARKTAEHVNRTLAIHQPTRQQDRRACEQAGSRASPALPGGNGRQPRKQGAYSPAIPVPPSTQDPRAHEQNVGSPAIPALHGDNDRQPCKQGAYSPAIPAPPSTQDHQTRKRDANKPAIPVTPDKKRRSNSQARHQPSPLYTCPSHLTYISSVQMYVKSSKHQLARFLKF